MDNAIVNEYKVMKRGFLCWRIGLVIFGIFTAWRIYSIVMSFSFINVSLVLILVILFIFNCTRIKMMREKYNDSKVEYKKEMLRELAK